MIVPHLDDPAVRGARNRREAFNIASRIDHAELARELAVNLPENCHTLKHGDMASILPDLKSDYFDCINADPPYGLNSSVAFSDAAKLRHDYADSLDVALAAAECIASEGYRVAKARAHLYMFCDVDQFVLLKKIVASHCWKPWRTPIIWDKGNAGHAPARTLGWRRSHELILFASKGEKEFSTVTSDVIRVPNVRDKGHAAEKPTELYVQLLKRSCLPRDRVLDPCCGSGTILQAAEEIYTTPWASSATRRPTDWLSRICTARGAR